VLIRLPFTERGPQTYSGHDLVALRHAVRKHLNLELAAADEIVGIACDVGPDVATIVPEKRQN
jgi:pyridoxine 5'-phosphate synthase PdxJ